MIRVVLQEGTADQIFAAIRTEWQILFGATDCAPFLSWEWLSVWFESFGEDRSPFILKAYRDDELIGILPMCLEKKKFFGIRMLSLMGNGPGGADHLDLIVTAGNRAPVLKAILDYLQERNNYDLLRLENMADDSETIELLRDVSKRKSKQLGHFKESVIAVCPQIDLAVGWESVLNQSKRKSNFNRKLKRLEKSKDFEYRSVTSATEIAAAFERFLRLHNKRWESEGGSELSGHPTLIAFQRRLVEELSQTGSVRFEELWVDGDCRSSVYGLDDGKTFYYYNSGYDSDYSHLSVGLVLLGLSIRNTIERGNTLYDFLRGDETYKFDWANQSKKLVSINLFNNKFAAIAHEWISQGLIELRNISKAFLPSGLAGMLRTWRRSWKRNYQLSGR